jgi:hypothetical protein
MYKISFLTSINTKTIVPGPRIRKGLTDPAPDPDPDIFFSGLQITIKQQKISFILAEQ